MMETILHRYNVINGKLDQFGIAPGPVGFATYEATSTESTSVCRQNCLSAYPFRDKHVYTGKVRSHCGNGRGYVTDTPRLDHADVKAAQRDRSAFAPLYHRYADAVYGYCLRRLNDPELAADVTAEVFTRALTTIGTFHGDSFRSWIFTIARNAVIDRYRTRKPVEPLPESIVSPHLGPEELTIRQETRLELYAALSHLTEQQQDVITLRLAGLTGKEIATAMNLSLGAVKATQVRAFGRLRVVMNPRKEHQREGDRV